MAFEKVVIIQGARWLARRCDGSFDHGRSPRHHINAMPKAKGLHRIMGDQKNCTPMKQLGSQRLEPRSGYGVKRGERLIHQHQWPILHQRARQGYPLALATGQGCGQLRCLSLNAYLFEQCRRTCMILRITPQSRAQQDILLCGEPGKEAVLLSHPSKSASQVLVDRCCRFRRARVATILQSCEGGCFCQRRLVQAGRSNGRAPDKNSDRKKAAGHHSSRPQH